MRTIETDDILHFNHSHLKSTGFTIGRGGMGSVHLYKWNINLPDQGILQSEEVAVKKFSGTSDVSIKDEAKILWGLDRECPYILHLYGLLSSLQEFCLVVEYMRHGNVARFFGNVKSRVTSPEQYEDIMPLKSRVAEQVSEGMDFLHNLPKPILHCDLKAENVLLDNNFNVKICDFGLAKIKRLTTRVRSDDISHENSNGQCGGTVSHLAPELLDIHGKPSKKSDVYSYGIFLWELLTDKLPYEDVSSDIIIMKDVLEGKRLDLSSIPEKSPTFLVDIMSESWRTNPSERPNFSEIRRRFVSNGRNNVDESVRIARMTGDNSTTDFSETNPKKLAHRSYDTTGDYFHTEAYPNEERLHHNNNANRPRESEERAGPSIGQPMSDVHESEACISSPSENNTMITTSVVEEPADQRHGYAANDRAAQDQEPLLPDQRYRPSRCPGRKTLLYILFLLVACAGTFLACWTTFRNSGCCVNCFDISDPAIHTNCTLTNNARAHPGSSCSFSCANGYILNGNTNVLTCHSNGSWSGSLPYCRKIRRCRDLPPPANSGKLNCTNQNFERSICSFQCLDGYRLRFPGQVEESSSEDYNVACQADQLDNFQWSGPEPYCEKIVACGPLSYDKTQVVVNCNPVVKDAPTNGTICQLSCHDMAKSLGCDTDVTMCMDSGKWNLTSEIACIDGCSALIPTPHRHHKCTKDRYYSSACTFGCDGNFTLVGTSNISCLSNTQPKPGKWSSDLPRCECPSCRSGDNCENTVKFNESWDILNQTNTTFYDGRQINCRRAAVTKSGIDMVGCQCVDKETNKIKQCNKHTFSEACYNAFASLILKLSYDRLCPLPCDAESMPGMCK